MSTTPATLTPNWLDVSRSVGARGKPGRKLMTVLGTRPEAIKLAPVLQQAEAFSQSFQTVNVVSGQHTDLLYPFVQLFDIRVDHNLQAMLPDQTPNQLCARVLSALDALLAEVQPDMILVQGDTTTALAGALAGFHRGVRVAHVEAGLRSGNLRSPYPEEMNRRLITGLASYHFAATPRNRETLLMEGVERDSIFVTGNPVVDSLQAILAQATVTDTVKQLLRQTENQRRLILTTHRRESFGEVMAENLRVVRSFVETHRDVALIFPAHPNPAVIGPAKEILSGHPRIHLIEPLSYDEFILMLSQAWLIVSDSGGVQEEAPTLGKPLLVLRENTERPEAIESGVARLVGGQPRKLELMLREAYKEGSWADEVKKARNPFGQGDSGQRIARIIARLLRVTATQALPLD
ncbi:MAG TPA: UDP-N-acetylglucosamine 2-epimerase (non-hydrolyzing) [Pyrinomonadaceae bacterium]|nr:UDP-N-acetylglucosamine 2-epimerase (non-hydrolyzing) [Pyrinomonadaceae bacterium]